MSLQACANIVHSADPARWRAVMAAPVASRQFMLPIYAANVEISRAPWVTKEPFIALMRLQWWRDALAELRTGSPRRHEVVDALAALPADACSALDVAIDARQTDVDKDAFANPDDLLAYARDTTFGAMSGCYRALGGDKGGAAAVVDIATALGTARVLQAAVDLKGSGWRAFGPDWSDAITRQAATTALQAWDRSKATLATSSPAQAAFIEAAGTDRFLRFIAKSPGAVMDGSVPSYALRNAISRTRYAWGIKPPAHDLSLSAR